MAMIPFFIRAISLDLDDTLWPIRPALEHAEHQLHAYIARHFPDAAKLFPAEQMRALRDRVAADNPHLAHDFTAVRKLSLHEALTPFGAHHDDIERAFEVLFTARNQVQLFDGALATLQRWAERMPLVSISNGNADLTRIGIAEYFQHRISAREFGVAKPDPRIFLHACERLGLPPEQVLHIGDSPEHDVAGAQAIGMRTAWIQLNDASWALENCTPDFVAGSIAELDAEIFGDL
jgi:FMN hydrolase / 5-amino-6-(5-phospho-D-ribitylamino)uracil phosphatase